MKFVDHSIWRHLHPVNSGMPVDPVHHQRNDPYLFASQQDIPGGHWADMMYRVRSNVAASVPFSNKGIDSMHYHSETEQLILTSYWHVATEQDNRRKDESVGQSVANARNAQEK